MEKAEAINDMGHFVINKDGKIDCDLTKIVFNDIEQKSNEFGVRSYKMKEGLKEKIYIINGKKILVNFRHLY